MVSPGLEYLIASSAPSSIVPAITLTASGANVTASDGTNSISKSVATATQATPSVSINSSGLITASATQTAGYVTAGTKSGTKQLTTQAAKTVTPSTSTQTAVSSGVYTTGAITVAAIPSSYVQPGATKAATTYTPTTSAQTIAADTYLTGVQTIQGDSNLIAGNIKSGVSIFGVLGSFVGEGGSGGGESGGGLPAGISRLVTGTITPTSNITSDYAVNHDLGVIPDFAILMLVEDAASTALKTIQTFQLQSHKQFNSNGTINQTRGLITYQNANGAAANTIISANDNTFITESVVKFRALSTYPLKAGYTFQWLCGTWA